MASAGGAISCATDPLSCPGQIIGGTASDAANSGLQALADGAFDFLGHVLKLLTTFWLSAPAPDLNSPDSVVARLQAQLQPLAAFALVVGLLAASARLMWGARGGEPGAFSQAMKGILVTVVVTGAGGLVITVLNSAFDQWANHILNTGFDGESVGKHVAVLLAGGSGQLGSLFAVVLYGFAAVASLIQFALMLVRAPVEVLLCVVWPVSAASAVTKEGSEAFRRVTGWLLSWSLYKLAAAIVYATAFAMIGDSKDETGTVEGAILLILAVVALPALIRLITPAVQAVPGGGGQFMMAGASAAGQITGAAVIMRSGGRAPQTHQVGKASPFSGGAAAGATAAGSTAPSGQQPPAAQPGTPSSSPAGAAPGAGPARATGAAGAAGPVGAAGTAGAAAAATASRATQQAASPTGGTGADTGIGAVDTTTGGIDG